MTTTTTKIAIDFSTEEYNAVDHAMTFSPLEAEHDLWASARHLRAGTITTVSMDAASWNRVIDRMILSERGGLATRIWNNIR